MRKVLRKVGKIGRNLRKSLESGSLPTQDVEAGYGPDKVRKTFS